ncbi:retrovirus-related pol polyprotein from transposon tnt 1-94 [Nicotiana attenuata]|uniref:Retrovirus-related pol polyprotein from transposon tnt 1-94 n=1 Tax=Nicotiana attenuata TaxID=49451 RepID=A0A314KMP7_NICAT|nr:retrovirus-related pol polyprotein from transposon tnt 1-94 [Nicotiana attenuata]
MKYATYVINRMPLSPNKTKSPYELMFGEKPSVKHLRVFGSICYVHIPDYHQSKLDAKARKCIFVGYNKRKKGWRCMDPKTHLFIISRDVIFDEVSLYYKVAQ